MGKYMGEVNFRGNLFIVNVILDQRNNVVPEIPSGMKLFNLFKIFLSLSIAIKKNCPRSFPGVN